MSDIVLSSSVRQNLLSLQSTADLLATTQTRLATGKKVNSALDNPTNFFTAAGLDARASDINNLLDGIGNGVQVLQAANTGITSLQKLVDTAKSIANQALQTTVGYSKKSSFTSAAIPGATADNLLGADASATSGTLTATGAFSTLDVSAAVTPTAATITLAANSFTGPLNVAGTKSTLAGVTATNNTVDLSGTNALSFDLSFDNGTTDHSITIDAAAIGTAGGTAATATQANIITALNTKINAAFGTTGVVYAADNGGKIDITSGTAGTTARVKISNYAETGTLGGASGIDDGTAAAAGTSPNKLTFDITVDGATTPTTVTIDQDAVNAYNAVPANSANQISDASALTGANVATLINAQLGGANIASYSASNQALSFTSTTTGANSHLTIGTPAVAGTTTNTTGIALHAITNGVAGSGTTKSISFNLTVDGATTPTTITLSDAALTTYNAAPANAANLITDPASALSGADVAKLINFQAGATVASFANNKLTFASASTGINSSVVVGAATAAGGATDTTGIGTGGSNTGVAAITTGLTGNVLSIAASTDGSIPAVTINFGTGNLEVKTLNDLNSKLASSHLQASLSTDGKITIATSNDYASSKIGAVTGTATDAGEAFVGAAPPAAEADPVAQSTRANLVTQYNNVIDQIRTTAQDASFNGVNLLNGDQLKLTFNETGKSTLNITGVDFNPAGLGLGALTPGTDFIDNAATNKVLDSLNNASSTLRGQASALGSNLSIVQIRQDFSKSLINVLQTGSSNLTLADTNEEAANSQALSTRQSIAVSALALANQSQQSVLQLLR